MKHTRLLLGLLLSLSFLLHAARAASTTAATAQPPGRVLIVVTSHDVLGKTGYPTGFWLAELVHPYLELTQAGHPVDIASPKGGLPPIDPYSDPRNPKGLAVNDLSSAGFLASPEHMRALSHSLKLSEVDATAYAAVLFAGGNGAVWDLAHNKDAERVIQSIWARGGVVATLCHGGAALLGVEIEGKALVSGKRVTAFSNDEEAVAQQAIGSEYLPFYLETELGKLGANYSSQSPFQPHVVVDGRLLSGQQNFSGAALGRALVEQLRGGSSEERVARRFFEGLWNARDMSVADELIPPGSLSSSYYSGVPVGATRHARDAAAMKAHIQEWLAAFPDITIHIESLLCSPGEASISFSATGTHRGTWFGLPATGRKVEIKGIIRQRIERGKIVEDWVMVDLLGVLQQLGVTKPLPELIQSHVSAPLAAK